MGNIRRGRTEREDIRIITNEWVEANCVDLTTRDKQMLKLLSSFSVMNSYHLHILVEGSSTHLPFYLLRQGQKRCNERIRVLYDKHCINKASPRLAIGEGTSKQYVWLDRAGLKLLGIDRRVRYELPQDYKHQSLILDVYVYLIQEERKKRWDLIYLQTEDEQDGGSLRPDLTCLLKFKDINRGAVFFIEVDRSEKKFTLEKKKIQDYRRWQLGGTWLKEDWAERLPQPVFPHVLYLFDETRPQWKRRATLLAQVAQRERLKAQFMGLSEFDAYLLSLFY